MRKSVSYILFILTVVISQQGWSQSLTSIAYSAYKSNDFDKAITLIDSAIQTKERFDSQTWQLRGFAYRDNITPDSLYHREIALESFVRAQALDSTGIYKNKINTYLKNTVIKYFNDAVTLLKEMQKYEQSEESYELYKEKYKTLIDPNFDFSGTDISYYNALAAGYLNLVNTVRDDQQPKVRALSIENCEKVIQIDSMNFQANLNIGLLNYNEGADYIIKADPFITIDQIMKNQEKSKESFKNALPYLHRAERVEPMNRTLLVALMSCYYGLLDNEKYLKYQTVIDNMDIDKLTEAHKRNPKDIEIIKELLRIHSKTIIDDEKKEYYKKLLNDLREK